MSVIRGIYAAEEEEDPDFVEVKTFYDAAECKAWYEPRKRTTNPDHPQCEQIYTTLVDWDQAQSLLLNKIVQYRATMPHRPVSATLEDGELPSANVYKSCEPLLKELRDRLDLPFHRETNEESTLNTFRYCFNHMRYGIFVMIRNNKLVLFVPFVNRDYRNTWGDGLQLEGGGDVTDYALLKRSYMPHVKEDYLLDKRRWWANGNMICNVESPDYWGDAYLPQLKHMLQTLCKERIVPDCELFINKRDFPQLKRDLTEPYDFIYDRDGVPLARERYSSYAPILSFFVGKEFADIPFVTTDDWEVATGRVFPPNATELRSEKNRKQHVVPWEERTATAFFRGNSTGLGADPSTNQRLYLAKLSNDNAASRAYGPGNAVDGVPFLDAGVIGFSQRDRKEQGRPMTFMRGEGEFGFKRAKAVPMPQQQRFKYHIYVDGHCAAMRYVTMMALGAVIIRVGSKTKADSMWFFPLLKGYNWKHDPSDPSTGPAPDPEGDHICVAADFSDLFEAIAWLKTHDKEAHLIQQNCERLYSKMFSVQGQLDYCQLVFTEVAKRFKTTYEGGGGASTSSSNSSAGTGAGTGVGGGGGVRSSETEAATGATAGPLLGSLNPSPSPPPPPSATPPAPSPSLLGDDANPTAKPKAKASAKPKAKKAKKAASSSSAAPLTAGQKRRRLQVIEDDEEEEEEEEEDNNDSFGNLIDGGTSSAESAAEVTTAPGALLAPGFAVCPSSYKPAAPASSAASKTNPAIDRLFGDDDEDDDDLFGAMMKDYDNIGSSSAAAPAAQSQQEPKSSGDWFGIDNAEYCRHTSINESQWWNSPVPTVPQHLATRDCDCPSCNDKAAAKLRREDEEKRRRQLAAAAQHQAYQQMGQMGQTGHVRGISGVAGVAAATAFGSAAARAVGASASTAGSTAVAAAAGAGAAKPASTSVAAGAAGPLPAMNDRMKAIIAERAALAKQKEEERNKAAAAAEAAAKAKAKGKQ